jgi:hypothetical protein
MTPRAFLLAISLLLGHAQGGCPDDFAPESFEECSDEMEELMEELFTERNVTLPLSPGRLKALHHPDSPREDRPLPDPPPPPGLWRAEKEGGLQILHILLKEPERLPETRAFNTYNDRFGGLWNDYDARAYLMEMLPTDRRVACMGRYLGVSLRVYGTKEDALRYPRTLADVILIDYTPLVERYRHCRKERP